MIEYFEQGVGGCNKLWYVRLAVLLGVATRTIRIETEMINLCHAELKTTYLHLSETIFI